MLRCSKTNFWIRFWPHVSKEHWWNLQPGLRTCTWSKIGVELSGPQFSRRPNRRMMGFKQPGPESSRFLCSRLLRKQMEGQGNHHLGQSSKEINKDLAQFRSLLAAHHRFCGSSFESLCKGKGTVLTICLDFVLLE